jgi:hypothetical protein
MLHTHDKQWFRYKLRLWKTYISYTCVYFYMIYQSARRCSTVLHTMAE